jgi:hypothetical protein
MSTIFALAGLNSSDYKFARQADQRLLYTAIQEYVTRANDDMRGAMDLFVNETTEIVTERYQLPMNGMMQPRADGTRGMARAQRGSWDVAFPIADYSEQVAMTDVEAAYMTPAALDAHIKGIVSMYANRVRFEILKRLFNSNASTVEDPKHGTLTIRPLANGDAALYPANIWSDAEATENHYLESNYAASAISDTNDPIVTIVSELEEHFGYPSGGSPIVVLISSDQSAKVRALTDFVELPDRYIEVGAQTDTPNGLPTIPTSARFIGRHKRGAWIAEWGAGSTGQVPTNYMLGIHSETGRPLRMRVDPAETGLPRGLATVLRDDRYPIESLEWRARFGFGAANRLNGVVMELGTGGSYTVPAIYA